MLKYLFTACVAFTLMLHANNQPKAATPEIAIHDDIGIDDEMFVDDECDGVYDKCIVECDDNTNNENDKCYSKCEELYEECLLKKEKEE